MFHPNEYDQMKTKVRLIKPAIETKTNGSIGLESINRMSFLFSSDDSHH